MICEKCSQQLPDDANYCLRCGTLQSPNEQCQAPDTVLEQEGMFTAGGGRIGAGIYVAPDAGKTLWVTDELMTFKVTGEETGGKYALTDSLVPPGGGPPPHIHHREDEAFWVLAGELEVRVGEDTFTAGAGSFIHLPRGTSHSYQNVGIGLARFLTFLAPAGLERFFAEVGKPGSDPSSPPSFGDEDIENLLAVAPKYGVEIVLPPES